MLRPKTLLLPLLLPLLPHPALTFDVVNITSNTQEKLPGYHGYLGTPPDSDWLTSTYCYCRTAKELAMPYADEGAFFQWDYYNWHLNTTYVARRKCIANHDPTWDHRCVDTRTAACYEIFEGECDHTMLCKSFPKEVWGSNGESTSEVEERAEADVALAGRKKPKPKPLEQDHMCVTMDMHGAFERAEAIVFNGQKRVLTKKGGQGRFDVDETGVGPLCRELCSRLPNDMFADNFEHAHNHQELFTEMDDMCEGCK